MRYKIFLFFCLIYSSFGNNYDSKIYIFSVRKSGTNLLSTFLDNLNVDFEKSHLLYSHKLKPFLLSPRKKGIILIRDPRDVCISGVFWRTDRWFDENPHSPQPLLNKQVRLDPTLLNIWNEASFRGKLKIAIAHEFPLPFSQINIEYEIAKQLIENHRSRFLVIKFEDLIGSKGGGSDEKQDEVIQEILKFFGIKIGKKKIQEAFNKSFGNTDKKEGTFRKGQIGSWKEYFDPEIISLFKETMNDTLLEWGYEEEWDWEIEK